MIGKIGMWKPSIGQLLSKVKTPLRPYHWKLMGVKAYRELNMAFRYARCYEHRLISRQDVFQEAKTFCMFVGHPRSGGSIVGALLDAHPNIILADEFGVPRYVEAGFTKGQICQLILTRSLRQARRGRKKGGRRGKAYIYTVPGQWQGRYEKIRIIGEKGGWETTYMLASKPDLLHDLQQLFQIKIKLIVIIRNPYDNISTKRIRNAKTLEHNIDDYFSECQRINIIRQCMGDSDMLFVRHEDFVRNPGKILNHTCQFLGVETSDAYVNACAGIVYRSPIKSRYETEWPPGLIEVVRNRIAQFDFLDGYSY